MPAKNKNKLSRKLRRVCIAIRTVRQATGKTQEAFAAEIEIAAMTLSRYERGDLPRGRAVLGRLRAVAADAGCAVEERLFFDTLMAMPHGPSRFESSVMIPTFTPQQWRFMQIARVAQTFSPDVAREIERIAAREADLVDEVMQEAALGERNVSVQFYRDLETKLDALAARKLFPWKFDKEGNL